MDAIYIAVALAVWCLVSVAAALFMGRMMAAGTEAAEADDVRKAA